MRKVLIFLSVLLITPTVFSDSDNIVSLSPLPPIQLEVFKSASCGCCKGWIAHLENSQQGKVQSSRWRITPKDVNDLNAIKSAHGIPSAFRSCHTALTASGYIFEGHIPARFIQLFLDNPPENALGLAVAGMPTGSPGMENGLQFQPYKIQLLLNDGSSRPFASVQRFEEQY